MPRDCCFYVYCVHVHFHRKKNLIISPRHFAYGIIYRSYSKEPYLIKCLFFWQYFLFFSMPLQKGFSSQYYLVVLFRKWRLFRKFSNAKGASYGAFLTDTIRVFDCFLKHFLLAKPEVCGFSIPTLNCWDINFFLESKERKTKYFAGHGDNFPRLL